MVKTWDRKKDIVACIFPFLPKACYFTEKCSHNNRSNSFIILI